MKLETLKVCSRCSKAKPLNEFWNQSSKSDGKHPYCKKCLVKYQKPNNRNRTVRSRYGISNEQFSEMFKRQNGRCAICKKKSIKQLCVDHDHNTGIVRGLLCHKCNIGLGWLDWSNDYLDEISVYLGSNL